MGTPVLVNGEKENVIEGYFNIDKLYEFVKNYLENVKGYDVTEKEFNQSSSENNRKLEAVLEAEQEYTDYFKKVVKCKVILEGSPVEVEMNGEKKVMHKGKAKLVTAGFVKPDWMSKRDKGPLTRFLDQLYNKYIEPSPIVKPAGAVGQDIAQLISRFRQHVTLLTK